MNTFVTTLRQDLVAIRWAYVAWLVTTFTLVFLPRSFEHSQATSLIDFAQLFAVISWSALAAVTFSRLALSHSPIDPHNGWRTRPIRPAWVAVEKFAIIALVFLVPVVVGSLAADSAKVPPLGACALILVAGLFVAGFVSTTRTLLLAVLVTGGMVLLCLWLLPRLFLFPQGISPTGSRLAQLVFGSGFAALVVIQYVRPDRLRHLVGAAVVLFAVASMGRVYPDPKLPPPILDRPGLTVALLDAHPLTDRETPGASFYAVIDEKFAERNGIVRAHRNWSVRLRVSNPEHRELWWVNYILPRVGLTGISHRAMNPTVFFPTSRLLSNLGLGSGWTFVNPIEDEFTTTFQWVRYDGRDEFPPEPSAANFDVGLCRTHSMIGLESGPLRVGEYSPVFAVTQLDTTERTMSVTMTRPNFLSELPQWSSRYSPTMLLVFNPKTRRAGLATWIAPTAHSRRFTSEPQPYLLPPLDGDPADWQLKVFVARADAQAVVSGAVAN